MKQNFWDYIANYYVDSLIEDNMISYDGRYMAIIAKKGAKFANDNSIAIFTTPQLNKEIQDSIKEKNNIKIRKYIYGYIIIDIARLKMIDNDKHSTIPFCNTPTSLMSSIKYVVLHECRHQQQHFALSYILNFDIPLATNLYNDLYFREVNGTNIFELDAENYGYYFTLPDFHNFIPVTWFIHLIITQYNRNYILERIGTRKFNNALKRLEELRSYGL